jgi:DDE family transposase
MSRQDLLLWVFCLIDDELKDPNLRPRRLRTRGPTATTLTDAEVLTIELVGEFWRLDADTALYRHFRAYHATEFPALARVHRTTFARQAANLWAVKQRLHRRLADRLSGGQPVWLVDSVPVPVCQFARATFCARFRGQADYGYDHCLKRTFYGFRMHIRASRDGVIQQFDLAPARASDRAMLGEIAGPPGTVGIGDRGYWDPARTAELAAAGVRFLAPFQHKSKDPDPARSARLSAVRYRLETVNGQLAERYQVKRTWARDLWHLTHRVVRKILSHTVMVWVAVRNGVGPLSFDGLQPAA